MSYPFTQSGISTFAPNTSGVYWIMNSQGGTIYVGESAYMQSRLLDHHNRTSDQSTCIWSYYPALFSFRELPYYQRLQVEREMINRLNPPCNL